MCRDETNTLPVVIPAARSHSESSRRSLASALEAQRLGQMTSTRGLRGGQAVIGAARIAYLSTQWSGADDRRPAPGLLQRTRV